jgi:hypothetical protein
MRIITPSLLALAVLATTTVASAQAPGTHSLYPHVNHAAPGQIGRLQLNRGPAVNGYVQPIEIKAAPWLLMAWADQGTFSEFRPAPLTLGLIVAPVYRFKVMGIPGNETATVYPTIEVIDRLYPPPGQAAKHPIPIEITVEDLRLALAGQFVTRVIYVEDPDQALPYVADPDRPAWFDAGSTSNPLNEADKLGRPVAILRIGGRQPDDRMGPDMAFLHGCPPLVIYGPKNLPPMQEPAPTAGGKVIQTQYSAAPKR